MHEEVFRVGIGAGGIGGIALGFKHAHGVYMLGDTPVKWRYEIVGSCDVNPDRNREFERLVGAPAHVLDLFTRPDYIAYHSAFEDLADESIAPALNQLASRSTDPDRLVEHEGRRYWRYDGQWALVVKWNPPPAGWHEAGVGDMHRIYGAEAPDAMFATLPCQGNSRLLSEAKAATWKYRALNKLIPRWFYLVALSWPDKPVKLLFSENVPGIKHRSKALLADMRRTAKQMGYATQDGDHDAGKVGGLAQSRPRHFWVQRHMATCPPFLYQPKERPLRAIKEVLGPLPMPNDPAGGPMHTLPNIGFETYLRLSMIPGGGDWHDIPGPGEWQLRTFDGRIVPAEAFSKPYFDKKGQEKTRWFWPDPAVWGRIFVAELLQGAKFYGDVRLRHQPMGNGRGACWVMDPKKPSGVITADPSHRKSGGASTIADDQLQLDLRCPDKADRHGSHIRVAPPDGPGGTVTGADHIANGALAGADDRLSLLQGHMDEDTHGNKYRVVPPTGPAPVVTGARFGSGMPGVADDQLRIEAPPDLRVGQESPKFNDAFNVQHEDDTSKTVSGGSGPSCGGLGVADISLGYEARDNDHAVVDPERPAPTIPGNTSVTKSNGPGATADPNIQIQRDAKNGTASVWDTSDPAKTITTHTDANGDAASQADARMTCDSHNGTLGVLAWKGPSAAIIASLDVYSGQAAVEDIRVNIHWWPEWFPVGFIISPWNAWHRPLSDWELWALQGFPPYDEAGEPYALSGSRQDRRQAIGNAVPPPTAEAQARALAPTLIVARLAPDAWLLSPTGGKIWVDRIRIDDIDVPVDIGALLASLLGGDGLQDLAGD